MVAADTIVVLNDQILEKPSDTGHAIKMLSSLQGTEHLVITAVTILMSSERDGSWLERSFHVNTRVRFGDIDMELLEAYIATNEPLYVCVHTIRFRIYIFNFYLLN